MITSETLIALISAVVAFLSLLGTILIYSITRHRENYQNLLERINFYFSAEMMVAVRSMWSFYRKYGDPEFLDKYIEVMNREAKEIKSMSPSERLEYERLSLHNQRRMVTQFWRGLSILMKTSLLPKNAVFKWWAQDDVDIVQRIVIPLENRIADHLEVSRLNRKSEPLYYLVKNTRKFYK